MSASSMVTYKSWLDTRWRFIAGFAVMVCSAAGGVMLYPEVRQMMPLAAGVDVPGWVGDEIRKAIDLSGSFDGYVWLQWNKQNMAQMGTLFAVLLGAGGVFAAGTGGGAFYTLALPVSRRQLILTRAAMGLIELLGITILSSLVLPLLAPSVGESYPLVDALAYGLCGFIGCSVFFSLTLLLATVFADVWRPVLIGIAIAALVGLGELFLEGKLTFGIFRTVHAETYFRTGGLPWLGMLACAAGSAALIYAAVLNIERRDY